MKKMTKKQIQKWMDKVDGLTCHRKPETAYKDFYKLFHSKESWLFEGYYDIISCNDLYDKDYQKEIKSLLTQGAKDIIEAYGSYYYYGVIRRALYNTYNLDTDTCFFDLVD